MALIRVLQEVKEWSC